MNCTKKDIEGRRDLEQLVDRFYEKVGADPILGPVFNDVARIDWEAHLPKMYAFWSSILFGEGSYKGDPMAKHIQLSQKTALEQEHFERWLGLFEETIEAHFEGPMADHTLHRARTIAGIMQHKVRRTER